MSFDVSQFTGKIISLQMLQNLLQEVTQLGYVIRQPIQRIRGLNFRTLEYELCYSGPGVHCNS